MHIYPTEPGVPHPLGAVADEYGVNFAIFSAHATFVELLLFARHDDPQPFQIIPLDPVRNLTFPLACLRKRPEARRSLCLPL